MLRGPLPRLLLFLFVAPVLAGSIGLIAPTAAAQPPRSDTGGAQALARPPVAASELVGHAPPARAAAELPVETRSSVYRRIRGVDPQRWMRRFGPVEQRSRR